MGTRKCIVDLFFELEDHPHACGDKNLTVKILSPVVGSSPRVWGQGVYNDICMHAYRIIPTRVGTSKNIKEISKE